MKKIFIGIIVNLVIFMFIIPGIILIIPDRIISFPQKSILILISIIPGTTISTISCTLYMKTKYEKRSFDDLKKYLEKHNNIISLILILASIFTLLKYIFK